VSRAETLTTLKQKLGAKILNYFEKSPKRIYLEVRPEDVTEATRILFQELQARFQIATGVDTPQAIEILYHWALDRHGCVVSVRTKLPREKPEMDSLAALCPAIEWIERDLWELLGVHFRNHPDLRHLLLNEDWPEGQYPLRRDFVKGKPSHG